MKKLLELFATSLLVSVISQPLLADDMPPPPVVSESPVPLMPVPSPDAISFTLQHSFNGDPLPIETIEIPLEEFNANPLAFFDALKQNFSKHLEKQAKPVQIDSELEFLLPTEAAQVLGKLPTLFIKTNIDENGTGKSDLLFPAYRREVPEKFGKGFIDWKGLSAQFTFTDRFENMAATLNLVGLLLDNEETFCASLGKTTFSGKFDADWVPTEIDLSLSRLKVREPINFLNLPYLSLKGNTNKTSKGLALGNLSFKIGHLDFTENGFKSNLDGLSLTTEAKARDGVVNFSVQTQLDKLVIPTPGETSEFSFEGELIFRSLDEDALLDLQTMAKQLQLQEKNSRSAMLLLGKLMEILPKFLAKSPELALNNLTMKTPIGNLQGKASISLNGKKVTSFFDLLDMSILKSALQAQADINIGKKLLEQILISQNLDMMLEQLAEEVLEIGDAEMAVLEQQAQAASEQQISMSVNLKFLVDTEDGNYKLVADVKDNMLILNGMEMALPF